MNISIASGTLNHMNTLIVDIQLIRNAQQYGIADALTYAITDPLHIPQRGQIVYVPLGKQIVVGVVISDVRTTTSPTFKPITSWATIALTPPQVDLAQWMARHYATPVAAILPLFIPSGAIGKPTKVWSITTHGNEIALHELPNDERGVLYLLRQQSTLSLEFVRNYAHNFICRCHGCFG